LPPQAFDSRFRRVVEALPSLSFDFAADDADAFQAHMIAITLSPLRFRATPFSPYADTMIIFAFILFRRFFRLCISATMDTITQYAEQARAMSAEPPPRHEKRCRRITPH
jgi:hypothetical protein